MKLKHLTNNILFGEFENLDDRQFINKLLEKKELFSDLNFLKYCTIKINSYFTSRFWTYAFIKSNIDEKILIKNFYNIMIDPEFMRQLEEFKFDIEYKETHNIYDYYNEQWEEKDKNKIIKLMNIVKGVINI